MQWLERRGEYLVGSHHLLRETLISQLGPGRGSRHQTLARRHTAATDMIPPWTLPCCRCGNPSFELRVRGFVAPRLQPVYSVATVLVRIQARGSSGSFAPAPALAPGAFGDELSETVA